MEGTEITDPCKNTQLSKTIRHKSPEDSSELSVLPYTWGNSETIGAEKEEKGGPGWRCELVIPAPRRHRQVDRQCEASQS